MRDKKNNALLLFILCVFHMPNSFAQKKKSPDILNLDFQKNNLHYFDSVFANKNMILIGESAHGIEQYGELKLQFIKYLHEKQNFNSVIFESGMAECAFVETSINNMNSTEMLLNGIFPVWHNRSYEKLFKYCQENNIKIYGIDNQYSTKAHSEIFKCKFHNINPLILLSAYSIDTSFFNFCSSKNFYQPSSEPTLNKYKQLSISANQIYNDLILKIDSCVTYSEKINQDSLQSLLLLKKIAQNRIYLIKNIINPNNYFTQRDSVMFQNLTWITDTLIQSGKEKFILLAHNSHISKTGKQNKSSYLGKLLNESNRYKSYSIGLYAYKGKLSDIKQREIQISTPPSNSVESHLYIPEHNYSFINLQNIKKNKQNNWVYKKTIGLSWGTNKIEFIPIKEYDALILVNNASPTNYIK